MDGVTEVGADARLEQEPGEKLFAAAGQKVSEEMIKATGRRWSTAIPGTGDRGAGAAAGNVYPIFQGALRPSPGVVLPRISRVRVPSHSAPRFSSQVPAALGSAPYHRGLITATIDGRPRTLTTPANRTLLDLLRDDLGLLGTKCGCESASAAPAPSCSMASR